MDDDTTTTTRETPHTTTWHIIPTPRTLRRDAGVTLLPLNGRVNESRTVGDDRHVLAMQLVDDIRDATGLDWGIATGDRWPGSITLTVAGLTTADTRAPATAPTAPGAYTLDITEHAITVTGTDSEGVRNGVQTLRQLIRQCGAALPRLHIKDQTAFVTRGYYLDVTRGRVPTLDWLKTWADKLCLYKYNQLQLYVEHTFRFDGMSETWRGSSPLAPRDILEFDDYCTERGIELVPSVSTFGHLYMALRTHTFRDLGEFPETADEPFGFIDRMRHHTLNISDDRAFDLSTKLIDDYLQLFRSGKFNICADETFDLGRGRSKPLAERIGVAAMYADYVTRLCRHLEAQGKRPMMWGDIALEHPEILKRLPETVTLLNWQYDPQVDDGKIRTVAESGATQIVCPAVWCWNALLPRIDDAWNNITRMARYGTQYQAEGLLVTDWGDFGHVNDPRMAVPGMIVGAQESWAPGRIADETDMLRRISRVAYGDIDGTLVPSLAAARRATLFGWDDLVTWLETGMPALADARARGIVAGFDAADATLRECAARLATALARSRAADAAAAFRIAVDGQRLLNRVGLRLARMCDGDDATHAGDATLAAALESWMEAYAAQWRTVSRESELRRVEDVIWRTADAMRQSQHHPHPMVR
ncbi:beta-N-acetylhexosaminidase [Bifidobacterium parmae]|uniref:beta-N-acetylhexosaminidase n=1 Tax=Bifidobacterium parmae TaxID=361854 RepID=A0A2N5J668_9BIFI|nr:glycoside hydrolase family 20 zincin-like fold domain-containing protein [Bifidobacterium parmae]PLS29709.1 glycosyl hydrolase [Bifidobacterium parmae]